MALKSSKGAGMGQRLQYVFWDLDGTLTDSAPGFLNSCEYALKKMGVLVPREELYTFIGPPLLESFAHILGSREKGREATALYREYFSRTGLFENSVYPGVPETLAGIADAGIKNVLTTAKPLVYARRILDHFDLSRHFHLLGGADLDGPLHSKQDVLADNLRRLGCDRGSVLMVGDRSDDIDAARVLSVASCGVLYGYAAPGELDKADYLCAKAPDVMRLALS